MNPKQDKKAVKLNVNTIKAPIWHVLGVFRRELVAPW